MDKVYTKYHDDLMIYERQKILHKRMFVELRKKFLGSNDKYDKCIKQLDEEGYYDYLRKKYRTIIRKYHLVEHENEFNEENILDTFEFYEDNGIIYNHIDEKNDASVEYQEEETFIQEGINIKLNSNNGVETKILYNNSYGREYYGNNDVTIIDVSNYENKDTFDYFKCRDEQLKIISNYTIKDIALIISDYSVEEEKTKKEQYNKYEYTENEKLYKKAKYFGCKRSLKNNKKCFLETNIIVNNKLKLYLYKRKENNSDSKHNLIQ